ncbi:tail assembly chaperone [Klebsiella sp. Ap-873]|nr:tail assembly chaperone [Klebsiella sp. Ap-873]
MNKYKWSSKNLAFFPDSLISSYEEAGWDISDLVDVSDDIYMEFTGNFPNGKTLGEENGMPSWVDIPPESNEVILTGIMINLGNEYKKDIADLNAAYLSAIVNDGPTEVTKQQLVRDRMSIRKDKYISDIADAKAKYPT